MVDVGEIKITFHQDTVVKEPVEKVKIKQLAVIKMWKSKLHVFSFFSIM